MFKYAQYFSIRHPKVIEDEKALAVVLNLDDEAEKTIEQQNAASTESTNSSASSKPGMQSNPLVPRRGRSIRAELSYMPRQNQRPGLDYEEYRSWSRADAMV